ncbi:phage tail length tape measure family protein [Achromobacter sp. AGC78]
MATAGSIVVDLKMNTGSFETDAQRASKAAEKRFKEIEKQAKDAASSVSGAFTGVVSGAILGISAGSVFRKFIEETKNAQNEQAQLAAVLKSTGNAAGFTASELNKMASGMAGFVSEGDINRAQTRLLSYTGVVGEEFPRALQAAIDMSVRLGMTVEQSAETVGKALDVPSKGLDALSKQGFRFTEEQKKLVESLESTGRVAEAQDVVLKALESSYGGAAEAARGTLGGALQALQNQIDDLMTGDDGSVNGLTNSVNALTDTLASDETKASFAAFVGLLAEMARQVVTTANVINSTSFVGWLQVSGAEQDNADKAIADLDEKLGRLRDMRKNLDPEASFTNRVNDILYGDVGDLDRQIAAAEKKREALMVYMRSAPNPYASVGETGGSPLTTVDPIVVTGSSPAAAAKSGKSSVDQGQKLIDQMNQRIALIGKETEYEKLLEQVRIGSVTFKTEAQKNEALASAQTLDFINEQTKAYEESQNQAAALSKVLDELYPDQAATNDYLSKLTLLTEGLNNGTLSVEQYYEAVDKLEEKFGETTDGMSEFAVQAARNIQDAMGDTLEDVLSGNFDNIGSKFADMIVKMAANAAAANLAQALFGDFGKSGQIGGLLGTAFAGLFVGGGSAPTAGQLASSTQGVNAGLPLAFADGGYTGAGGKYDPAGIVHAGEYVIPADATRRLGVGFLDRLKGYADGGYVGAGSMPSVAGSNTRVEIVNNGTPQQVSSANRSFDAQGEVIRIVVRDIQRNGDTAKAIKGMPA